MSFSKRCHGMELLPRVMYEMVKHSLGNKSIKCVVDDDECIFTSDMEVLLSSLTIEHPVGELIYQALKSHKEQFGEGIRTYMFMITRIAKAVSQLEDLGIRSAASLAVIQEVINELSHQVQQICISIKSSSTNEINNEVKPTHPSIPSSPQKDDSSESTIIATKPIADITSGDSSKATATFSGNSSSHRTLMAFDDNLHSMSTAGRRNFKKSINDQPVDTRSSDYACLLGRSLEEDVEHQPLIERSSLTSDHPVLQIHELPDSVICEHLVPGIVMESDPVVLKMSDLYLKDENKEDDIDWYFDDNFVKDEFEKQVHQKSIYNARLETEKTTDNAHNASDSSNSESNFSTEEYQQEDSLHKNTLEERRHHNLTDSGNQHDSDFEDCFDDLENRKQVVVVVERIEDLNSHSHTLPPYQEHGAIMKSRMACNIQRHFAPMEFETVSDVPSLNDCQSDKEFIDCFDNAIGCDSQGRLLHSAFYKTYLDSSEPQMNQLGSDLKQEKSVMHLKSLERSTSIPPRITSDDAGNTFPSPTSCKHTSELVKLNSILSSINVRKSQNVKEILVSSRHKVDEMYFKEFDDKIDIKSSGNSEERSHCDFKSDMIEQSEIPSLKALNHQTESIASIKLSKSNCETVSSALQKNNTRLETTVNTTKAVSSSTPSAPIPEVEKLNSILSSINVKKSQPQTRQILLSSRHGLKEDDLIENGPSTHTASKEITDFSRTNTSPEVPTSCTFRKSSVRAVTDHEQHEEALDKSGGESCRYGQFDLESVMLPLPGSDSCVTTDDVKMRKKHFLILPTDLRLLTRGHEDIIELIERLHSSSTSSPADEEKRLNPLLTHCVSIQSPKSSRAVIEGLVIPCSSYDMDNLRTIFGCQLNAVLINGDLTPTHRHKGYKPVIAKKNLIKSHSDIASQGKEVLWASGIAEIMKQLGVSAIFIRGNTTSVMSDVCLSAGIVPLTNTSYHALRVISQQMKVDMLCYAEDASKSNVCEVYLEPLNPSWMDVIEENHCLLVRNLIHVKSVVLSEPCALAAQISEEKFWRVFYRVSNAICDGMVLPGGGITELWCFEQIKQMTSNLTDFRNSDEQLLKVTILETLADVFHDFYDTVKQNTGLSHEEQELHMSPHSDTTSCKVVDSDSCDHCISAVHNEVLGKSNFCEGEMKDHPEISDIEAMDTCVESDSYYKNIDTHFDALCSKISAWRSAVDVVGVVNSLDCLITTGASEKDLDFDGILL